MRVSFIAGFGPIVRDTGASRQFWGDGRVHDDAQSHKTDPEG
jgi:hypothetical protein